MTDEHELLAQMRAAPEDEGPRLVYADWLLARGDARGELIVLDERDRAGRLAGPGTLDELERLLALAAEHGFPRLPDDPCARILPFTGGGSFPVQYHLHHADRYYYLRWRYGFSIEVDDDTVLEGDLDTLAENQWTLRETTVILAIVSDAILGGAPLSELAFPSAADFPRHPRYHVGRAPAYVFPDEFHAAAPGSAGWTLAARDFARWYALWDRRQQLRGLPRPAFSRARCACGVDWLSCGVRECEGR